MCTWQCYHANAVLLPPTLFRVTAWWWLRWPRKKSQVPLGVPAPVTKVLRSPTPALVWPRRYTYSTTYVCMWLSMHLLCLTYISTVCGACGENLTREGVAAKEKVHTHAPQTSLCWVWTCIVPVRLVCVLCVQVHTPGFDGGNMEDTLRTSVVGSSHVSDSESTLQEVTRQLRK